jgi:hypothetical protein
MAKHSPGPYVVCTNDNEPNVLFIEQDAENLAEEHGEPSVIGEVYLTGNGIDEATGRANATLWASAPDMLKALRECITDEASVAYKNNDPEKLRRRLRYITKIVIQQIARATGE